MSREFYQKYTEVQRDEILRLWQENFFTVPQIAAMIDVNINTARRWILFWRLAGVERNVRFSNLPE